MLLVLETRLLNGHGSEMEMEMLWIDKDTSQEMELKMEMEKRDGIRKMENGRCKRKMEKWKWETCRQCSITQYTLYGSGCRKLCKG